MKLFAILLLFSFSSFAKIADCYKLETQEQKNECMAFERDQSVGRIMSQITLECSEEDNVLELAGSEEYSMALDECITQKLDSLYLNRNR